MLYFPTVFRRPACSVVLCKWLQGHILINLCKFAFHHFNKQLCACRDGKEAGEEAEWHCCHNEVEIPKWQRPWRLPKIMNSTILPWVCKQYSLRTHHACQILSSLYRALFAVRFVNCACKAANITQVPSLNSTFLVQCHHITYGKMR